MRNSKIVYDAMNLYITRLLSVPDEEAPVITKDYSLLPIYQKDHEVKIFQEALNQLDQEQRKLIIKRFLEDEEIADYLLAYEMGLSERTYYRLKKKAFDQIEKYLMSSLHYDYV